MDPSHDDDQINMINGRCIMNALSFLNEATENELLRHITATGHPQNVVKAELKRVLECGVTNGFIMKNDKKYLLPRLGNVHQVDSGAPPPPPEPLGTSTITYRVTDDNGNYLYSVTFVRRTVATPDGGRHTSVNTTIDHRR